MADSQTLEVIPIEAAGSVEESEILWQIIKAIQETQGGQTQIIIGDSSKVEVLRGEHHERASDSRCD